MKSEKEEQIRLFHQWYIFALTSSGFIVIVYIFLHLFFEGKEIKVLSPEQVTTINALIIKADTSKEKAVSKIGIKNYLKVNLLMGFNEDKETNKVIDLLVDENTLEYLELVLPTYPFEVKSFFWMKGFKAYAELLYWIWFGVLSSVLYTVVNVYNTGNFSSKLIYDHIAKLFYAPPVSFILYFSSNLLISQNLIALDKISNSSIVFVFILGFFSGRAIELLNRLKDVIIPLNADKPNAITEEEVLFNLNGIVKNASEQTDIDILSTKVFLKSKEKPSFIIEKTIDKDGRFEFLDIPAGLFQIEARFNDKDIILEATRSIFIKKDSNPNDLSIVLDLKKPF